MSTSPHDCQEWQAEVLAEARQHAGRDLAHDEETALITTLLVADLLAATRAEYAKRWLMTEGVTIVRAARQPAGPDQGVA